MKWLFFGCLPTLLVETLESEMSNAGDGGIMTDLAKIFLKILRPYFSPRANAGQRG